MAVKAAPPEFARRWTFNVVPLRLSVGESVTDIGRVVSPKKQVEVLFFDLLLESTIALVTAADILNEPEKRFVYHRASASALFYYNVLRRNRKQVG